MGRQLGERLTLLADVFVVGVREDIKVVAVIRSAVAERKNRPFAKLNTAVLMPIPSESASSATTVKPALMRSILNPYCRS
jgi:hypothetical protein